MYKVQIETKQQKIHTINTTDLEGFIKILQKNEVIWMDNGSRGLFIPPTEIALILFEKQENVAVPTLDEVGITE